MGLKVEGAVILVDRCLDDILETLFPPETDLDDKELLLEEDRLCDIDSSIPT